VNDPSSIPPTNKVSTILVVGYNSGGDMLAVGASQADHSKIGFSVTDPNNQQNPNWVCLSDINRESTQLKRGGITVSYTK
jgi:hypothetical protein